VLIRPHLGGDNQVRAIAADTVVLVTANQPLRQVYEELHEKRPNMNLVGDAQTPRNLGWAIWEAHRVARAIA